MAELSEKRQVYYIPDNYIEEGRIFQGSIKVKNLIQGAILAAPFALLGWLIGPELKVRIVLAIVLAGPLLCIGIVGYNGDALFTVLKSFKDWRKNAGVKLYNPKPTPFYVSPTETIFATELTKDKLVGAYEDKQKKRIEEHMNQKMVEGQNFEFADDPTIQKYHDESQKPTAEQLLAAKKAVVIDDSDLDELLDLDDWSFRRPQTPLDFGDDDII